jgi:hypothetical protein
LHTFLSAIQDYNTRVCRGVGVCWPYECMLDLVAIWNFFLKVEVDLCRLIGKAAIIQLPFISVRTILVNRPSANSQQAFFTLMFILQALFASPFSTKTLYGLLTLHCVLFSSSQLCHTDISLLTYCWELITLNNEFDQLQITWFLFIHLSYLPHVLAFSASVHFPKISNTQASCTFPDDIWCTRCAWCLTRCADMWILRVGDQP